MLRQADCVVIKDASDVLYIIYSIGEYITRDPLIITSVQILSEFYHYTVS